MTRRDWMRHSTTVGLGALTAVGCRRIGPSRIGDPSDGEITPSAEDYATARKGFRTKLTRVGPSPEPAEMPSALGVPGAVPVTYPSGGLQLIAWVNPEAKAPGTRRPAVMFLHGGFAFGKDHWEYARPFLRAGFHVMIPVLRAENSQPGAFSFLYDEVDDCLASADLLSRMPGVDPGKIFLCGHSVGGTMALLCALASERFRACAAFSPWPSAKDFLHGRERLAPFDPATDEEYRMRSPLPFAAHFFCPVRSFYGKAEGDAVLKVAKEMGRHARGNLKDVGELIVEGDHLTSIGHATVTTLGFFKEMSGLKA